MTTTTIHKDHHPGDFEADTGTGDGSSTVAVTDHHVSGIITTENLTTASGSTVTVTLTNRHVNFDSVVLASCALGTATQGLPQIVSITPAAAGGSVVIIVKNIDGTNAFNNGTITIAFYVVT